MAADDDECGAGRPLPPEPGQRFEQNRAAFARFDTADGQEHEAIGHSGGSPPGRPPRRVDRAEAGRVHAVVDDDRVDAEFRS